MTREIPLTQGKVALVDDEDYVRVALKKWHARLNRRTWYARRALAKGTEGLHAFILGLPPSPGLQVDHINGDGLDNRRANLRWVTPAQNQMNRRAAHGSSQYRGVYWRANRGRWVATLRMDGKGVYLGSFVDETEAARAWDKAAAEAYGEYAALNFPLALAAAPVSGGATPATKEERAETCPDCGFPHSPRCRAASVARSETEQGDE